MYLELNSLDMHELVTEAHHVVSQSQVTILQLLPLVEGKVDLPASIRPDQSMHVQCSHSYVGVCLYVKDLVFLDSHT